MNQPLTTDLRPILNSGRQSRDKMAVNQRTEIEDPWTRHTTLDLLDLLEICLCFGKDDMYAVSLKGGCTEGGL
ncbi:hypothetical protein J6590_025615 [Homalodisca vitripennis]|nr:hypothetical protein J6590_025615 [Homalodisca vitripennis]